MSYFTTLFLALVLTRSTLSIPEICPLSGLLAPIDCVCNAGSSGPIGGPCRPCDLGYSCIGGDSMQQLCPPGTYSDIAGQSACTMCGSGTVQINVGAQSSTQCVLCMAGTYQTGTGMGEISQCLQCKKGTYQTGLGMTASSQCIQCLEGTYQPITGLAFENGCLECPQGTFQTMIGNPFLSACTPCLQGTYQESKGSRYNCTVCKSGTYLTGRGSITELDCYQCKPGTFSTASGAIIESTCIPCLAGTYHTAAGQGAPCTPCNAGTYLTAVGTSNRNRCIMCFPGSFQTGVGASSIQECQMCSPGTFSLFYGASSSGVCQMCSAGTYQTGFAGSTPVNCTLCPAGTYQTGVGATVNADCRKCASGTYQSKAGESSSSACLQCVPGKYQVAEGASTSILCLSCPRGSFQPFHGATHPSNCTLCKVGTYQTTEGAADSSLCVSCQSGTYGTVTGADDPKSCKLCQAGTYSTGIGISDSGECIQCEAGFVQIGFMRSSPAECKACMPGTYQTGKGMAGVDKCIMCQEGTYQTGQGMTSRQNCVECPWGSYQPLVGMVFEDSCIPCSSGKYQTGVGIPFSTQCISCRKGTFQSMTGSTGCIQCGAGTYQTGSGMSSVSRCTLCPAGTFQTGNEISNITQCLKCGPGTYQPLVGQISMEEACLACIPGTYQPFTGVTSLLGCKPCIAGTYQTSTGVSSMDQCTQCETGVFSTGLGVSNYSCVACLEGTFASSPGTAHCQHCDMGKYQHFQGQTACSVCPNGTYQPFSGVKFDTWCLPCESGKYQSNAGGTAPTDCRPCLKGTYSPSRASSACILCPPGKYQGWENRPMCFSCMSGFYSSQSGATVCNPCGVGSYTNTTGASNCNACTPGFFQYQIGSTTCVGCRSGEFQPNSSSTRCMPCIKGTFQSQENSSSCYACSPGLYAFNTGSVQCIPCPTGRFQPVLNSTSCEICTAGTYQSIRGETGCLTCALGFYQPKSGETTCLPCPMGHFQTSQGSVTCSRCKEGTYGNKTAQASQDDCANCTTGTFSDIQGTVKCKTCSPGRFSGNTGQTVCHVCPPGSFQVFSGRSGCNSCRMGTFSTALGMTRSDDCKKCPVGYFGNDTGATSCTSCPKGKFQTSQNATSCRMCAAGTYMTLVGWGASVCTVCGPGTFSSALGASQESTCSLCPDGFYSSRKGQTADSTCMMCQRGTISTENKTVCPSCGPGTICPAGYHRPILCVPGLICNGTSVRSPPGFLHLLRDNCTSVIPCPPGTQCSGFTGALPPSDKGLLSFSDYNRTHIVIFENGNITVPTSCPGLALSYGYRRQDLSLAGQLPQTLFMLLPLLCKAGQYLWDQTCTQCDPGTFSTSIGALHSDTCSQCLVGKYSSNAGATLCSTVDPGQYSNVPGTLYPSQCPPGSFQSALGSTGCDACTPGTYADSLGMSMCLQCPAGKAQADFGADFCDQCDDSHFSSPGDARCSLCGAVPTELDPAHECFTPRLPQNLTSAWITVQGEANDDCIGLSHSSVKPEGLFDTLSVSVFPMHRDSLCLHTLRFMGRPELTRTWTVPHLQSLRPSKLTVFPYNQTFYPGLCAKQGFGVLFIVQDILESLHTDLSGARAVISIFDQNEQNLLFWMVCSRLPRDTNEKIPLGACHVSFCPTMPVLIQVSLTWPGGSVEGFITVSPGPVLFCPPTGAWTAVVDLISPSIPYFPGELIQIRVRSLNSPASLAVFKFALKILAGVSFVSFDSAYSTIFQIGDNILSVMGDTESSQSSMGDVLGVATLKLDAAFSGVLLVAQIVPNTFQFTLENAVPYNIPVHSSGFSCRSDGYVDLLTDVQRFTSLIAAPKRRFLINWKTLQDSALLFPTSIDVVGVTNVVKLYSSISSAQCTSLSPEHVQVQSCASISPVSAFGTRQALVSVHFQGVSATVNLSVVAARNPVVTKVRAASGLSGRFKVFSQFFIGDINALPGDVDATPFLGPMPRKAVTVRGEQWTCTQIPAGANFTIGKPLLLSGECLPNAKQLQPGSVFVYTGGEPVGLGGFRFYESQISMGRTQGFIFVFGRDDAQGLFLTSGIQGITTSTPNRVYVNSSAQILNMKNSGASARCIALHLLPGFPTFPAALIPVFPPAPSSLHIALSSRTLVTQQDMSGFIPSSTFVTEAVLILSDDTRRNVLTDARLQLIPQGELDVSGLAAMARTIPGDATITFRLAGMDCISTVLDIRILPSPIQRAELVCPACPLQLTMRDDPLSQQFPLDYPSTVSASLFIVRRFLGDGNVIDKHEDLIPGTSCGRLENQLFALQPGSLSISTRFTPSAFSLAVQDRVAVSWSLLCNQQPCIAQELKLAPAGDGAGRSPFSYTTQLTLSLSLGFVDGTTRIFQWLPGVECRSNGSKVTASLATGCQVPLVYGALAVDAVFDSTWKMSRHGIPNGGHQLFVHRLDRIILTGPTIVYQIHCSLIWEEANYTTIGLLTDGVSALVPASYSSTPPLVIQRNSDLLVHAEWEGRGRLTADFSGHVTHIQVTSTRSSHYFDRISLDFLPDKWATAHDHPLPLLPKLYPVNDATSALSLVNVTSRVLKWTSSVPGIVNFNTSHGIMTLLSDFYQELHITSSLIPCGSFAGGMATRDITVNVAPSQAGDIDFGEEETGLPMPDSKLGEIISVPIFIYAPTSLQSYILEVYLPETVLEPVDCTCGVLPNSQCGVVYKDGKSFCRSVGAFAASRLTGRILVARVQGRILLNSLAAMRVSLIQAVFESSVSPSQEYTFILKLGNPSPQTPVTTNRRILPSMDQTFGRVYGDTDGDGHFTSADILFLEYYIMISVFKPPHMICPPLAGGQCQSTADLTQWQLMQLKPVRNPNLPASKPDGSDVLFLMRALAGKAFFLAALETEIKPGLVLIRFRLCDYTQDCNPSNVVSQVQITAPANPYLAFTTQSSYEPSTGIITVDCQRMPSGEHMISTLATTVTFDEALVGFRIITQSLDLLGSPDSFVSQDRRFIFNPLGPLALFNILASENPSLEVTPSLDYLPTTNCEVLCDDASLFLDNSIGPPTWINDTALYVDHVFPNPPRMQGFWSSAQSVLPPSPVFPVKNVLLPRQTATNAVWVGGTFNVTVRPYINVIIAAYQIQISDSLVLSLHGVHGGELSNNILVINTRRFPFAILTFLAKKQGEQAISVSMIDSFPVSNQIPILASVSIFAPFIASLNVQPQCSSVILWSRLGTGGKDETCTVLVTPVWSPAADSVASTFLCQTYPCIIQAFGQLVRPVISIFIPLQPSIQIQRTVISLGHKTQWRVSCELLGLGSKAITVNQRALASGVVKTQPANALLVASGMITGVKLGVATINFAGAVAYINVTNTVNIPRSLRGFVFTGITLESNSTEKRLTANFVREPLVAGKKAFLFVEAIYSGGFTLLLDPKPQGSNISVRNASGDVVVSQIDGSITVRQSAKGGADQPLVFVSYRGVELNISATIVPVHPSRISVCCDVVLAGPTSSLVGLFGFPSEFSIANISVEFIGQPLTVMALDVWDPRISISFDRDVLEFVHPQGVWVVKAEAPAELETVLTIGFSQPSSLVTVSAPLRVQIATGVGFEVIPSSVNLNRIHCSSSAFETSRQFQAFILLRDGVRVSVPSQEIVLSSSDESVVATQSDAVTVTGVQVGVAAVTVSARGFSFQCQVEVLHQSVSLTSLEILSPTLLIQGTRGATTPIRIGGTLEDGTVLKDISFLSPTISVTGPASSLGDLLIIEGNSNPGNMAQIQVDVPACPLPTFNVSVTSQLATQLTPVISSQRHVDVVLRIIPGPHEKVSVRLVGNLMILGVYIQIQTDIATGITCDAGAGLPVFSDCTPDAPTQGSVILAAVWGSPIFTSDNELELAVITPIPETAWGFVEVFTGMSVMRIPIVAGEYGQASSSLNPVNVLMPAMPIVDTSVLFRHYGQLFRLPTQPLSARNALFHLLLLVYKQRNVDPRLYSNEFEISAMFRVTDRFLQPDINSTTLTVFFHTDSLPPLPGGVYDPEQGLLKVPATHVQDGWYVVEWREKIPVLSLAISFSVATSFTDIVWPWQITEPLITGGSLPSCPRSATNTGTFLATYYLTGNITQALIDHIVCHVKVAARRVMVSTPTGNGKTVLSLSLESLERVHQANMVVMSDWFVSQLAPLDKPQGVGVERALVTYINDTRDPPTPCPSGYYFSKNGTYQPLPVHAYAGPDCYDIMCIEGYTLYEDPGSLQPQQCVPHPATFEIVWICTAIVLLLVAIVSLFFCCVQFFTWKTRGEDLLFYDENMPQPLTPLPVDPQPFSDEDELARSRANTGEDETGHFRNIVTSVYLDDVSAMILEDEFSPRPFNGEILH